MTTISVIIVNYNGRDDIGQALASIERQSRRPDEIIVVDNASTDGSTEYLRTAFSSVKVVRMTYNSGFSGGCNAGLANAHGDYVALLNSDAWAEEGWLDQLAQVLDRQQSVAAAVPKILGRQREPTIEQAGALFNNLGHCWSRGLDQVDRGQFETVCEVPVLTGCSVLLRRAALGGQQLFDPDFFMYYEELELSLRLRGAGAKIVYVPSAVVHHAGMRSVKRAWRHPELFQQFFSNRNRLKILAKYYPWRVLLPGLPLIALSVLYWDAIFAFRLGPSYALRAIHAQITYASRGLRERASVRELRADLWLPWMTRHSIRDALLVRRAHAERYRSRASQALTT